MEFLPYGDSALLINFEQKIDEQINQRVIALHQALEISGIEAITFLIPAYCSITVGFDPMRITYEELKSIIASFAEEEANQVSKFPSAIINIPVCYEPPFAMDFDEVSNHTHLSSESIIALHTSTIFRVYMLGFVAGFTYMGILPKPLECPRKAVPRLKVPTGSVGLAGLQTGIYPSEAPGGWQIIGQTPLTMFDPDKSNPSLLQPGDRVRFKEVDTAEFERIKKLQSVNEYRLEVSNE